MAGVLRLCTAGSVDDGKSTLIGRLLYDSRSVYEDQVQAVERASRQRASLPIDFSYFTDGLRAEREQGITIDVAYRYFATSKRRFILADTPGHEQYTRNMATGASTADVAILLVDVRHGIREQTRRHARIATLLGISDLVLAVNKMDLVGFDRGVFERIAAEFAPAAERAKVHAIPLSALEGDNVAIRSHRTPWYGGPSLLEHLETMTTATEERTRPFRLPVQYVIRADGDFRGYAGQIGSGSICRGDAIRVWPAGQSAVVSRIMSWRDDLDFAQAPQSVALVLDREIDVSRGDLIATDHPTTTRRFDADIVWMDERPLSPGRLYILKHRTGQTTAELSRPLALNEIGRVSITTSRRLCLDEYALDRSLGSFILIDPSTGFTSGAGLVHATSTQQRDQAAPLAAADRLARVARAARTDLDATAAVEQALEELFR